LGRERLVVAEWRKEALFRGVAPGMAAR
jgi:hypothetical protein